MKKKYRKRRYITELGMTHESRRALVCGRGALAAASLLETRTGEPRDQPRAARKLSVGVLLPTVRRRQFQDVQPRDVGTSLLFPGGVLLGVGCRDLKIEMLLTEMLLTHV